MADFYIAPTGSDTTGSGTIGSPWRTIGKFLSAAGDPGDTLYCRGGTWQGSDIDTIVSAAGTSGSRITIRNYPGETPIFAGGGGSQVTPFMNFQPSAAYITVRGLRVSLWDVSNTGVFTMTGTSALVAAHGIILENNYVQLSTNVTGPDEHAYYVGPFCYDIDLRGSELVNNSALGDDGAGVEIYHDTATMHDIRVTNNLFRGWNSQAIQLWRSSAYNVSMEWNTFVDCTTFMIDARHGATGIVVRNNIGDSSAITPLYNPNSIVDTNTNNYWTLGLTGPNYAATGAAINGAHDGSNAGWTRPTEGVSVTPTTKALTLTTFAPTVTAVAHRVVTPSPAALTLHTFAPSLDSSFQVTPPAASLNLATFQPNVYISQSPTPVTAVLTLTTYIPRINIAKRRGKPLSSKSIGMTITSPSIGAEVIP